MRFNTVIYFRYIPLTKKTHKECYMDDVVQTGISVEYWDLSAIYFKNSFNQEDSSHLCNTRKFKTYQELENAILEMHPLSDKLFISLVSFEGRVTKLYKLFTKYNCILAVFGRNIFPEPPRDLSSILFRIKNFSFQKVKQVLHTKNIIRQKKIGNIKPYDIIFLGGEFGWKSIGAIEKSEVDQAEIINVNSNDYDDFITLKSTIPVLKSEYILFLDEYLPLHPDTKLLNIKTLTPEQYYPQLNAYFDRVEHQFGIPIVIAAHPKAMLYKTKNFFGGREVVFNKTGQLSKYASFVIAHDSTSINYPIAFGKKLHFITSTNIFIVINSVHRTLINFSNFLGCNYQWFDKPGEVNLIEELPMDKYNLYKYKYQTSIQTENRHSKEIFIDYLTNAK